MNAGIKMTVKVAKGLRGAKGISANQGLVRAVGLLNELWTSIANPKRGSVAEGQGLEKFLHCGYSEHDWVERSFSQADRVECQIRPWMHGCVRVEIFFWKKGVEKPISDLLSGFTPEGEVAGGVGYSG